MIKVIYSAIIVAVARLDWFLAARLKQILIAVSRLECYWLHALSAPPTSLHFLLLGTYLCSLDTYLVVSTRVWWLQHVPCSKAAHCVYPCAPWQSMHLPHPFA